MTVIPKIAGALLGVLLLGGCVSTTNQPNVNVSSAHDKRVDLGMQYLSVGKRDNARRQFTKALEYDKNSAQAWHGIGLVHEANGEMEPAAKALRKAIKLADGKTRAPIAVSYGKFLMNQKQPEKACPYFDQAADDYDFSRRWEALYLRGQCAAATGRKELVKPSYEHAVNLNNNYPAPIIELAEIYFAEGQYAKSKRSLDQFLKLTKPTAQSLWLGIRMERVFGNKDKEASYALALKNLFPYSQEHLEYKRISDK